MAKGAGLAMGIAMGVAIGVATGNVGLWIALGVVFGIIFDASNTRRETEEKHAGGSTEAKEEKEQHLAQILAFAAGKESIRNDEVQALLGVSDATTERYLDELEQAGKLTQVGKTGQGVFYKVV
jgi:predicted HTH transcriptional regulator